MAATRLEAIVGPDVELAPRRDETSLEGRLFVVRCW